MSAPRWLKYAVTLVSAAALVALAVVTWGGDDSGERAAPAERARSGRPVVALTAGVPAGTKIGLVVSTAGPGKDVRDLAAGAYVALHRLTASDPGQVVLVVEDDEGTEAGAAAAVQRLADEGVLGIVYASAGDHMRAGVAEAAARDLAVLAPYNGELALTESGHAFLTGPSDAQAAAELASRVTDRRLERVVLVHQAGAYGDAGREALARAGLPVQSAVVVAPDGSDAAAAARTVVAAEAGAVVVWADLDPSLRLLSELKAVGVGVPTLFSPRVAVPAFGRVQQGLTAPAATDGLLSAGVWAGPATPSAFVDAFYLGRDEAAAAGTRANLTAADIRSHDAVLALVAAAADAASAGPGGLNPAGVLAALRDVESFPGAAGVPLRFRTGAAVADSDVALLTYSTVVDGRGRVPDPATDGGHWMAVAGTYDLPGPFSGLDDAYGG